MNTGFIQVAPDSTGKQLDNDVVQVPAGTVVTDGLGNQTTLTSPQYYFRERIVVADSNNPSGLAPVRVQFGLSPMDMGLSVQLAPGQADLQTIAALLLDIDTQLANINGTTPLGGISAAAPIMVSPVAGLPPSSLSPTMPRPAIGDMFGRQIVVPYGTRESFITTSVTITSTTSAQTLLAAPADVFTFNDLLAVVASNTSAIATELDISDGNSVIPLYLPAGDTRGISLGVAAKSFPGGTAWTATTLTSVASVKIWAMFFANKSR